MPFHELCSILVREPFCLRPWEIARLSWYQIWNVYLCECDEHGKPVTSFIPGVVSRDEADAVLLRRKGLTDAAIADLKQKRDKNRKRLEKKK